MSGIKLKHIMKSGEQFLKIVLKQSLLTLKHSARVFFMSLQVPRHVEGITGKIGRKSTSGSVFLEFAKAFDTIWIDGLLYKLTLNVPS